MPEAPPDRVPPNPLQRVAPCATVVTVPPSRPGRTVPASECVMPSHLSADHPAAQPPGRGSVDALISQTRRLKGDVDAVRRDAPSDGSDPQERWQRALYDLALHQLTDLDEHLAQLRDGPPPAPSAAGGPPRRPRRRQPGRSPPREPRRPLPGAARCSAGSAAPSGISLPTRRVGPG